MGVGSAVASVMATHAEIEAKMRDLTRLSPGDPRTCQLIEAYINSLPFEDRLFALQFGALVADTEIRAIFRKYAR